jgi:DNA replication protein DnaC
LFRLVAGAYERRSLAIGSHWPFEEWGRFLPEQTTAVSILDRLLHHATVVFAVSRTSGAVRRIAASLSRRNPASPRSVVSRCGCWPTGWGLRVSIW